MHLKCGYTKICLSGEWNSKFQKESKSGILCMTGSQDTVINTLSGGPKAEHLQNQKNVWLCGFILEVGAGGRVHTIK